MLKENRKRKILFIILEIKSASGLCVENLKDQLIKQGYLVDLLSYDYKNNVPNNNCYTIRARLSLYFLDLINNTIVRRIINFVNKCKISIMLPWWPWISPFFTIRLYFKTNKLFKQNKYDIIVPVYSQIDPIIVGYIMKKKYKRLLIVDYFIDSLSGGPTPTLLNEKAKIKKGLKWEKKLLSNADSIIMMKSSQSHYQKYSYHCEYYSRIIFLDIPFFLSDKSTLKEKNEIVKITYIGTLPKNIRSATYGLKMLENILETNFEILVVCPNLCDRETINLISKSSRIKYINGVSHQYVKEYIQNSDIMLNFGNKILNMVPSKIFEYMSYCKPILSFSPTIDDPSIPYLEKYPNKCIIIETDDYKKNCEKLLKYSKCFFEKPIRFNDIKDEYYLNSPSSFIDEINKLL